MGLNEGAVGMSGLRIAVLRLSDRPISYDDIFYEEDYVLQFSMLGKGRKIKRMIVEIGERPNGGNRMVAVSTTKVEMHKRICVV